MGTKHIKFVSITEAIKEIKYIVITPDIRGHGDSGGKEGDAPSPEQVFDDIGAFIRHVKAKYSNKPVFL